MDQEKEGTVQPGSPEEWVASLSAALRALREQAEQLPAIQRELERLRSENQGLQERLVNLDSRSELERLRSENQELKQQISELETTSPSLPTEVVPPLPAPSSDESRLLHAALTTSLGMIWEELGRLKQRLEQMAENLAALPAGGSGPELRPLPGIAEAAQVMHRLTSDSPAPPRASGEVPPEEIAAGRAAARAAFALVPEPPPRVNVTRSVGLVGSRDSPPGTRAGGPERPDPVAFAPPYVPPRSLDAGPQPAERPAEAPAPAPAASARPTTWQRVWKWLKEN